MSKKNRLNWADLGLIINESEFTMPEPSDSILTNIPDGSGTDEALALIDGGSDTPGLDWSPEMQDQPKDSPADRTAVEIKDSGEGITAKVGGGEQASDQAADAGEDAAKNEETAPFKKQDESFRLNWADLGLVMEGDEEDEEELDEDEGNPFKKDEGGQQGQQDGGQQSGSQKGGQQSGGQQSGSQKGGQQSGGQQSGAQKGGQQSGGQQADSSKGVDECSGGDKRLMDHNMGAGEIAVDQDLMKEILRAAVTDQPDDSQIDLIVQAISGCCGEDRTLGVADVDLIMSKLKELAGGQQGQQGGQQAPGQQGGQMGQPGQQAPVAGQQGGQQASPEQIDSVPAGDGEVAGPEGGQQHEGKTKLMASLGESKKPRRKMTVNEAWVMAVPGVGAANCMGETGGDDEIDDETIELRRMARRSGNPDWFNVGR